MLTSRNIYISNPLFSLGFDRVYNVNYVFKIQHYVTYTANRTTGNPISQSFAKTVFWGGEVRVSMSNPYPP
jgi:hypothetical protein